MREITEKTMSQSVRRLQHATILNSTNSDYTYICIAKISEAQHDILLCNYVQDVVFHRVLSCTDLYTENFEVVFQQLLCMYSITESPEMYLLFSAPYQLS